ncbi:hypothetical protein [Parvularcula dongshanensis]|uniref:Uncharacterized protein n=1 Tax=Parvularcula dongshanensis TaxID=1173995 RepID=A0A840I2U3_9PROT|nr:hypothetical protein [Parvularcula dongshanensis]MBB4659326.1 hypothetical protein [Parvularcula dongshanensis]
MQYDIEALLDAKIDLAETVASGHEWDLFISAYNNSERVQSVFPTIPAIRRSWWAIPEYGYTPDELQKVSDIVHLNQGSEAQVVKSGLIGSGFDRTANQRLCVDITGLMRTHILFLMAYLQDAGVSHFDLLYTEPAQYSRRAETRFSIGEDVRVVSVEGYVGTHELDTSGDLLVVGIGYDHHLISHAIQAKENARVIELHSFPSLSADMYHESILRLDRVSSERSRLSEDVHYASANDPFVVAASLAAAVKSAEMRRRITNVYLSPLATKPQAVGFGLHYLKRMRGSATSIVYPVRESYDKETSTGVGRSWIYPIHL